MPLVTITDLSIGFRGPPLLDEVTCLIDSGQRIGLLGRNGAGKTTFMRLLCGDVEPDSGSITLEGGAHVSLLPQDVPKDIRGRVGEIVAQGFPADHDTPQWQREHQVDQILTRMDLDADSAFETFSSGMKRRVLLAQALVSEPALLLLDEPTNHLDIEAINWLENFLLSRWQGTLLFVTHDRAFLRRLANRILEVDRGRLFDWSCDYDTFLRRKEELLAAEEKQNALFDKKLAEEEAWIRQGIKARRTRNEGRVRALKDMRRQRAERRTATANVRMKIQEGRRSGNLVADVEEISFAYGDRQIVRDFSTSIMRGDKVGIIGANGAGKTTLLRLILGKLAPQHGNVRLGTNLQLAYFDQLREQLDDEKTVQENVGDGYDTVDATGGKRHVIGYLQDFLFTPERARTPVRFLSGGERNRVLLAKLFAKPANVIVLDEPTNDLDTETLELLEERLIDYQGTVLLVSHDREFLNNVVTSTIVFEPAGAKEYVGGYDDWLRQRTVSEQQQAKQQRAKPAGGKKSRGEAAPESSKQQRRLTFNEKRELESIPAKIEQLEAEIAQLHEAMAEPEFYQQPGAEIAHQQNHLKALDEQLAEIFQRWEELEALSAT